MDQPKATIVFNSKIAKKRSRRIIDELSDLDDGLILPSQLMTKSDEPEKVENTNEKSPSEETKDSDDWLATIATFKAPKPKKSKNPIFSGFEIDKKGAGKKKKKGKQALSHKKDFEPEIALLRNLQIEQDKFVDSLQKKYDQLENTKSTARGIGKYTTDLVNSITSARQLSMQIADKSIAIKKTIADLDFKEKKEFGSKNDNSQKSLNDYTTTFLKQMTNAGRGALMQTYSPAYESFEDMDPNESGILSAITDSLSNTAGTNRSDSAEKYLKYENDGVEIVVDWYESRDTDDIDNKYEFIAYNKFGDIVEDYPLPMKTRLNINRSTGIATDTYGNKYKLNILP